MRLAGQKSLYFLGGNTKWTLGLPICRVVSGRYASGLLVDTMTKSELIELIAANQQHLAYKDVELAVKTLLEHMSEVLSSGDRIEIRGFGSFSLHHRPPRIGRNPKTGDPVALPGKYVPHFKPGKQMRERVNSSRDNLSANRRSG